MPLEAESRFFESRRHEWLKEAEGRFALIKGQEFSFHDTDEEAYRTAVDKYGDVDVFIKQILTDDPVEGSFALLYGLLNAPR